MTTTHYKQLVDIYIKTGRAFRVLGFEPHPPGVNNHMHLIQIGFGLPPVWAGEAKPRRLLRLAGKSCAQIDRDWSRTQWPRFAQDGRLFWMPKPDANGSKPGCFIILGKYEDGDGALETEMDIVRDLAREEAHAEEGRRHSNDEECEFSVRHRRPGAEASEMDLM